MYLMVDNYDSFTGMLASYFMELGADVVTMLNDDVSVPRVQELFDGGELEGIIISPGPKSPEECGNCKEVVQWSAAKAVPLLGVCLGHQVLASVYGATVERGRCPMHGKVSPLHSNGTGLFSQLPDTFSVTRYHSLVVREDSLPPFLKVDAHTEDGAVMALRHDELPLYGVQFHPEAARTDYGHALIANFMKICAQGKAVVHG